MVRKNKRKTASSAKSVPKNRTPIFHDVPKRQSETFNNLEKMNFQEQAITIQQVSQKLDVPKPTLRFWEREFEGILVPLRTNGGQRRYAPEHVSVIKEIKLLKKAGLSLIEIKRKMGKGPMSEAGSQGSGEGRRGGIDLLAERVAEVVRLEILRFFERERDKT